MDGTGNLARAASRDDALKAGAAAGGLVDPHQLYTPEQIANFSNTNRTRIFDALNPDPAHRAGIPHLRSVKIGRLRRIRGADYIDWVEELIRREAAR